MYLAILAIVVAALATLLIWYLDRRVLGCRTFARLASSMPILGIGVWLFIVVLGAQWMQLPSLTEFRLAVLSTLLTLGGLLAPLAGAITIAEIVTNISNARWKCTIVPLVAILVFSLAVWCCGAHNYFVTA